MPQVYDYLSKRIIICPVCNHEIVEDRSSVLFKGWRWAARHMPPCMCPRSDSLDKIRDSDEDFEGERIAMAPWWLRNEIGRLAEEARQESNGRKNS